MIVEDKIYIVKCDCCGCKASEEEDMCYPTPEDAVEEAIYDGFVQVDDKHYCPKCAKKMGLIDIE